MNAGRPALQVFKQARIRPTHSLVCIMHGGAVSQDEILIAANALHLKTVGLIRSPALCGDKDWRA